MVFNGKKLREKFKGFREERRKVRERAATSRAATKEAFLKEKEVQEVIFAKKKAKFQVQQEFKQFQAQAKVPSLKQKAKDYIQNIQIQPMGFATGFEQPSFAQPKKQQGVDMGIFGSMFAAPQQQAPKKKKARKAKKTTKKRKKKR